MHNNNQTLRARLNTFNGPRAALLIAALGGHPLKCYSRRLWVSVGGGMTGIHPRVTTVIFFLFHVNYHESDFSSISFTGKSL